MPCTVDTVPQGTLCWRSRSFPIPAIFIYRMEQYNLFGLVCFPLAFLTGAEL